MNILMVFLLLHDKWRKSHFYQNAHFMGEKRASGWEWEFNEEEVKKTTHSHELFKTNQSNRWNN